jgi:hypothetical protein
LTVSGDSCVYDDFGNGSCGYWCPVEVRDTVEPPAILRISPHNKDLPDQVELLLKSPALDLDFLLRISS